MNSAHQTTEQFDLRGHDELSLTIISDTHGYLDPGIAAVARDSDMVLHAGDIMDPAVLDLCQPRLGIVIAVRGNNDVPQLWKGQDLDRLQMIPDVALLRCPGGDIAMEHGHMLPSIDYDHFPLAYKYPDARLVVYGHLHIQRLDRDSPPWLLNPGAAGVVRNHGGASCYRLHISADNWQFEAVKIPAARKAG